MTGAIAGREHACKEFRNCHVGENEANSRDPFSGQKHGGEFGSLLKYFLAHR